MREAERMEQKKTESVKFDFKKAQRELIRRELRPILYEHGFVLCRPTAYIRERGGLLQEFYFKVEVSKLRPWVSGGAWGRNPDRQRGRQDIPRIL